MARAVVLIDALGIERAAVSVLSEVTEADADAVLKGRRVFDPLEAMQVKRKPGP
jgi:hypothetical protein